jgi:iron(III) transport system permease protein
MTRVTAPQFCLRLAFLGLGVVAVCLSLDSRTAWLAANTARLAATTCAVGVPLGTILALVLVKTDVPGRRLAMCGLAWLLFLPLYLQVGAWQAGFGLQGWQTLAGLGPAWLDRWRGAVWVHSAAAIPWVVLIVGVGLRTIRTELEEAALLDASAVRVLGRVTLRQALPAVVTAALWVAVSAAGEIAVTDLFQIRTYAEELYTDAALGTAPGEAPLGVLAGIAVTSWLVLAGLVLVLRVSPRDQPWLAQAPVIFRLGRARWPMAVVVSAALALLIGLPLANLAWKCGVRVEQTPAGRERHWSAEKCLSIVETSPLRYRRELSASLVIASAAATGALLVSTFLAWRARASRFWAATLALLVALGWAIPGPIVGLGIIAALNRPEWPWALYVYDRTVLPPALAQMIRALPLVGLILWYAFQTLPSNELEAAELDGASSWATLRYIALPQRASALVAAWLVAFAIAIGDMGATILVVPPGVEPLSVRISGLLHYGVEDQVAGICLALALVFFGVSIVLAALVDRWLRPGPQPALTADSRNS